MSAPVPTPETPSYFPRGGRRIVLRSKGSAVRYGNAAAKALVENLVSKESAKKQPADVAAVAIETDQIEETQVTPVADVDFDAKLERKKQKKREKKARRAAEAALAAEAAALAEAASGSNDKEPAEVEVEVVVKEKVTVVAEATAKVVAKAETGEPVADDSDQSDKAVGEGESIGEVENTFAAMDLPRSVHEAIQRSGYVTPSEIQAAVIPPMLAGRDVVAQSQTGSGKTAAFALPILAKLKSKAPSPQVLVLAPTRELAVQVAKSFETYAGDLKGFSIATIYGGQDYEPQLRLLRRGVSVIVGTPGRVIDHVKRGSLSLDHLRCLVLDEADEMLNMGFLEDVEFVLQQCPAEKQVALFSATMPNPIRRIAEQHLR
ncbi:MAG: DEAD/DEAH box helicase, partial [Rubripirellula sp.]